MSLPGKRRRSPAEGEFLFELDAEPLEEAITAYAAYRCSCEQLVLWMSGVSRIAICI